MPALTGSLKSSTEAAQGTLWPLVLEILRQVTCYHIEYRKTEAKDVQEAPGNLSILATYPSHVRCNSVGKLSTCVSFIITHLFVKTVHICFSRKTHRNQTRGQTAVRNFHTDPQKLEFFWEPSGCFLAVSIR